MRGNDWQPPAPAARRLTHLFVGLVLYGFSMALMIRSGLGLNPWDVFHQGLSRLTGLSMGTVVIAVGALVLLAWIPLRQRPGLGTVANVVVIGLAVDATLALLPPGGHSRCGSSCWSPGSSATARPPRSTSAPASDPAPGTG